MRPLVLFVLTIMGLSSAIVIGPSPPTNISDCYRIQSSGTYVLNDDLFGADWDVTGMGYEYACIVINASNVVFDCDGYSMTGYSDQYGIFIDNPYGNMRDNITIRNCDITNYNYGIFSSAWWGYGGGFMNVCDISDNRLSNNYQDLFLPLVEGCRVERNNATGGIQLISARDSLVSGNNVSGIGITINSYSDPNPPYGLLYSNMLNISFNYAEGCYNDAFNLQSVQNSTIEDNTAFLNEYNGFYLNDCYYNNVTRNLAANNSLSDLYSSGFEIGGYDNLIHDNTARNNSNGFDVYYTGNVFRNNHALHNYIGMNMEAKATNNTLENNVFEENVYVDMLVAGNAREISFNPAGCANTIINTTGSGGRPIFFSNQTVNLNGGTYSEVILCGANQSALNGVTVRGSDVFKNNGFVLLYVGEGDVEDCVSDNNAIGFWLHGSENTSVSGGHAAGNYVGYLMTYSHNAGLSGLSAYGNEGSMPDFFAGKYNFLTMMPLGGGVIEVTAQPRFLDAQVAAPAPAQTSPLSNNTYEGLMLYNNTYGMGFVLTSNATVIDSDIFDNSLCGILDGAGTPEYPVAVNTLDSRLYRNGRDFMGLFTGTFGGSQPPPQLSSVSASEDAFELEEGILWTEYVQASWLFTQLVYGLPVEAIWSLDDVRHGTGSPSVLLSAADETDAMYITTETTLGSDDSFQFWDSTWNHTVYMNITPPENNKTSVKNKFFSIIAFGGLPMVQGAEFGPTIDEAAVGWGDSSGYDESTMELYYLNILEIQRPKAVEPVNYTVIAEWLPVPSQELDGDRIYVDGLVLPEAGFLNYFLGIPDGSFYQGFYGIFATPAPGGDEDEDGGNEPGPETPEQNESQPECTSDSQCAVNERCVDESCGRFPCECGEAKDHQCVKYACCVDGDCPSGESCYAHQCLKEKPAYECMTNAQCPAQDFCDIQVGAEGGTCEPVEALPCGEVRDHAFVAYGYECGSEAGCPSCPAGAACVDHMCQQSDVSCPTTGIVGDKKTCAARENNQPCPLCDYQVTAPNGQVFSGKTDESGNFELPLAMNGTYKVALLKDGQPVRIVEVKAFPQAQPADEGKPTPAGPDASGLLWVLVLLALVAGGIIYLRSRGKGQKKK